MKLSKPILTSLIVLACLFVAAPAQTAQSSELLDKMRAEMGQRVMSRPDFAFPENRAELDRLLDNRQFAQLTAEMRKLGQTPKGVNGLLSWLQYRIFTGGGYWVSNQYAITLWNVGLANARGGAPGTDDFKMAAVRYAVYTMAIVKIDSAHCHDPSAGPKHWERLMRDGQELWKYARTMPLPVRERLVDYVPELETNLSPLRERDEDLCRYGDEELAAGMAGKDWSDAKDCKHVEGLPGMTCDIVMPKDYKPEYLNPGRVVLAQFLLRAELPDTIRDLLDLPKPKS